MTVAAIQLSLQQFVSRRQAGNRENTKGTSLDREIGQIVQTFILASVQERQYQMTAFEEVERQERTTVPVCG